MVPGPAGPAAPRGFPELRPAGGGPYARNLGFSYESVPYGDGTFGVRLTSPPAPGSPAAGLGLEPGDVVFALDGQRFRSPADVLGHRDRTTIDFTDVRSGQARSAVVLLP